MIALVAVFALPGGIAQAETVVSNIGQSTVLPRAIVSSTQSQAQAFTTGSAAGGYELESVDLEVLNFVGTTSHISVSIYSEASGEPGSEVHALSNPATIAGNGVANLHGTGERNPGRQYDLLRGDLQHRQSIAS